MQIITHVSGKTMHLGGRRVPRVIHPHLHLRNYLMKSLPPTPPGPYGFVAKAQPFLSDILGNDTLGDCTCAGAVHQGGLWLGNAGALIPFVRQTAIDLYERACGYIPGDPSTDQGGDLQTVLAYVQKNGLSQDGSHKIAGYVSVDATNDDEMNFSVYALESGYSGFCLPQAWIDSMSTLTSGSVWDVAGDPTNEGHCVPVADADKDFIYIDTWGMIIKVTRPAWRKYWSTAVGGEVYAVLGPDSINKATGKTPEGFDNTQLVADLEAIAA